MRFRTIITCFLLTVCVTVDEIRSQALPSDDEKTVNRFLYRFDDADDRNYDTWPDHWERRRGPGFPHYVQIGINQEAEPEDRHLSITLDGGAAEISTPKHLIDPRFSYYLECDIRTHESETREHNEAWVSVEFRDAADRVKARFESRKLMHQSDFQQVRIGPMVVPNMDRCHAVVRLHVHPTRPADLFGGADFDNISLSPSPRLLITTNQPHNIFRESQSIEVSCRISGVQEQGAKLTFQLFDAFDRPVAPPEERLLVDSLVTSSAEDDVAGGSGDQDNFRTLLNELDQNEELDLNRELTIRWVPPVDGQGYYRVQVKLMAGGEVSMSREQTMVVIDDQFRPGDEHFGWTLPRQNSTVSLPQFTDMLRNSGVRWVKYPVWYGRSDDVAAEWIAEFADRLAVAGIEFVGILDVPPEEHLAEFARNDLRIASVLREPELWQPAVNHVLTRLSLKVRRWQLGADDDMSFVGYPDVYSKFDEIRETLSRYAKDIEIGLCWHWLHFLPQGQATPWDFSMELAEPILTAEELKYYLQLEPNEPSRVWTSLQPLPSSKYSLQDRIRDLVGRMLQIKVAGCRGFVTRPFADEDGLMRRDGTPNELYVPWRTTSVHLAGMEFIGSVQLPNKSENYVFSDGTTAMMLVWNESPTTETIYLGEQVVVTDIWGRSVRPERELHRHVVHVDAWPRFITGLDLAVARFRMTFEFDRERLASVFGQRQMSEMHFDNVFPSGASGQLRMHSPHLWAKPIEFGFKAAPGERFQREYPVVLRSFASTGRHPVRIDFSVDSDRQYEFSIFRDIQVGFGQIEVEHHLEVVENGAVRVRATLINNSYDRVSFDMMLLVPGQRRQRRQILGLNHGRDTIEFTISNTIGLEGKEIWLRAEEIRGNRVLNHRFQLEDVEGTTETE